MYNVPVLQSIRYKLILAYDGTSFFGWQKTKTGPSIQEALETAVRTIFRNADTPEGASRTDRGVHAEAQAASIDLDKAWDPKQLVRTLNALLPPAIRIIEVSLAASDFHPSLHAIEKEYRYRLCLGAVQDPTLRLYSWAFPRAIDIGRMEKASRDLLGLHNFSALANEQAKQPACLLSRITFSRLSEERLEISMTGDRFLYKMARNIVGTLVYIGCGKLPEGCIPELLASKNRPLAGMTAPARGLFLFKVYYSSCTQ